jgi:hypothetical protein
MGLCEMDNMPLAKFIRNNQDIWWYICHNHFDKYQQKYLLNITSTVMIFNEWPQYEYELFLVPPDIRVSVIFDNNAWGADTYIGRPFHWERNGLRFIDGHHHFVGYVRDLLVMTHVMSNDRKVGQKFVYYNIDREYFDDSWSETNSRMHRNHHQI